MKPRERCDSSSPRHASVGQGEMAELIRAFDWSRTPIGPREQWPASLRTLVDVLTATHVPVVLLWGPELILIYNDAYRVICGEKHPAALGQPTREVWAEVWHISQPIFAAVMERGETLRFEDKLFPINRHGYLEDAYFSLCYSPVRNEDGVVSGVLVILEETTERKKAQEAWQESERRLREAQQLARMGTWVWNLRTGETRWSAAIYTMHGLSPGVPSLTPDALLKTVHPDDRDKVSEAISKAISEGARADIEYRIIRPDGSTGFIHAVGGVTEFDDEQRPFIMVGTNQDITERKQAEAALHASEERFHLFMDNSPTIAWIKDDQGRHVYLSRTFELRFGVRLADWSGKTDAQLWPAEIAEKFRRNDQAVLEAGHAVEVEEETINPDGSRCYWLSCKFPFSDAVGKRYVAGIAMDITERKRAEALLQQAERMAVVGQLAGGMAHEFNNLIQGIVGYTELCRTHVAPDHPVGAHLNEINVGAMRAVKLVRQLLSFARKQVVMPDVFDLNEHVAAFLTLLRRLVREDVELIWKPCSGPLTVKMDASQVDQVLANLAANSSDAIQGAGRITLATSMTTVDASTVIAEADVAPGRYVMLSFSDTGCGMDEATRRSMFEPFFTTKEVGKGTGMGLASVHGIVKQNKGFVTVESESGKGTTLRIGLPLYGGQVGVAGGAAAPKEGAAAVRPVPGRGGATILLVDDDPTIVKTVTVLLKAIGYTVLAATSPEEALRLEKEHDGVIDLLLTDVVMPGQNGHELADQMRARRPGLKCLYMSGYPANHIAEHGVLEQEVNFLAKPFNRDQLADKLRQVLNNR